MTFLLIITAWTLALSLITALCAAARLGDRDQLRREAVAIDWDTADHMAITAHAEGRPARTPEPGVLASAGRLAA
jgi:hypothetical protein